MNARACVSKITVPDKKKTRTDIVQGVLARKYVLIQSTGVGSSCCRTNTSTYPKSSATIMTTFLATGKGVEVAAQATASKAEPRMVIQCNTQY